MKKIVVAFLLSFLIFSEAFCAPNTITAFSSVAGADGVTTYSLNLKILMAMIALTFLPAILMAGTAFTRVIIVLSILRQAIGLPNTPTNQILLGITLLLTFFIMSPVINKVNETALQPYLQQEISEKDALKRAIDPFKNFMINQTRKDDLNMFMKLSGNENYTDIEQVSLSVLMAAFVTSELKTAFQIGFILFIPFLIIDLVVASILMSMGMMMLSPLVISLPFKILLFVLVNGWVLVIGTLSSSFVL